MTATDVRSFSDLGVDDAVIAALTDAGITTPFPIQELSLPMALAGADLIGQARTGTGKTLAFGIPLVQRVDTGAGHIQALVVVPTRELCLQVHDDLVIAGAKRDVRVVAAYGGRAIDAQSEAIAAGASIVVGTPGRLLDLVRRGLLNLSKVTMLVLDEADEMLDMGFLPDVEQLIERCADQRQTLLFSATVPSEVVRLARSYMNKPTFMRSDVQQQSVAPQMRQFFFACHRLDKPAVVARILASPSRGRTLIFTRTKRMADILAGELRDRGIDAGVIHSDLRQEARERALVRFRKGTQDVLCATEVAARGLDIEQVTHVVNYDCPDDERMYLHRIGRTGRAGAAGVAVTLAVWNELARLEMIKKALQIADETHEVFSTSPLLDDLFGPVPEAPEPASGAPREVSGEASGAPREVSGEASGAAREVSGAAAEAATGGRRRRARGGRRRRRDTPGPTRETAAPAPDEEGQPAGPPRTRRRRVTRSGRDGRADSTGTAGETTVDDADAGGAQDADTAAAGSGERAATDGATATGDERAPLAADGRATTPDDGSAIDDSTIAGGAAAGTADGEHGQRPADAGAPEPAPADARASRRTRGRVATERGRRSSQDAGGRDAGGRDAAAEGRRNGGRRDTGARDDSGRVGDRGRGRRTSRQGQETTDTVAETVSPASRSARGSGKPSLHRPLEISHLP